MKRLFIITTVVLTLLISSSAFAAGIWTKAGEVNSFGGGQTVTLLNDGRVLVVGGLGKDGNYLSSAKIYNPQNNTWTSAADMKSVRTGHKAILLPNGKVLVIGGLTYEVSYKFGAKPALPEIYNPASNTWETAGTPLSDVAAYEAILLKNNKVLVIDGYGDASALYDYTTNTWSSAERMATHRTEYTATLLQNGKVLVVGGKDGKLFLSTAEIFDPVANTWSKASDIESDRVRHNAILLANGKVLITGGISNKSISAEIYDPIKDKWETQMTIFDRENGTATLLKNGKVLVVGGYVTDTDKNPLRSVQIYDPVSNTWSLGVNMISSRELHSATLLADGKVLVCGGLDNSYNDVNTTEIYDPVSNTWNLANNMKRSRTYHTAILLQDGNVLVVGGYGSDHNIVAGLALNSAEIFDPNASEFSAQLTPKVNNAVLLCIGNNKAYTNGNAVLVDDTNPAVYPIIKDDRTLVPVRFISENLGAKVGWDGETSTAIVALGSNNVEITIGSNIINVNGTAKEIDVPAQIVNERTFIPLRALVEALNKKVFWDDRGLIAISDIENIFNPEEDKGLINEVVGKFETVKNAVDVNAISKAQIETSKGTIVVQLANGKMPITVTNFTKLVNEGFYDGLTFHRVEDWVIQGGDPNGNGTGGSKDKIKLEIHKDLKNVRGALAMARSNDPNSATCQFYILKTDASWLDGQYAVFGDVLSGMEVVDKMEIGDKINSIKIIE